MKRVVVTGMGIISPVGNTIDAYWQALLSGKCGVDFITKFDTADFKVKIAAEVKDFDPAFYMEKSDARRNDLFTQYALAAAHQAMEDSGIQGTVDPFRLGTYIGSGVGGLQTFGNEYEKYMAGGPRKVSPFFIPMMIANMASGAVAIRYGARGPSLPVVTACATGTQALGEAFHAIKYGYADAIIAGGAEAAITPIAVAGFTSCMALSTRNDPASASIPFDAHRDGFVMGEGAGVLILEEYEHAKARGAKIYGEIKGYGNTCDASHITAPDPTGAGAAAAIKGAVMEAGMENAQNIYINAHGTSTPLNDKTETLAIKVALTPEKAAKAFVSSTKSMTGHMLGAAGAVEAIASLLALQSGNIPPTIGYSEPDPECDLNYVPNTAIKAPLELALSTSLGFGGHNACIAFVKEEG